MSNEIRIKSISDFVKQISELELSKNCTRFFRGHSDKDYLLEPSIYRTDNKTKRKDNICIEHKITKDVLTECAEYFSPHDTLFDKLVKIQHYDYPTRLLDISYNALVGLYFAISNSKDELKDKNDGEVIIFDIPSDEIKYHDSDTVAILSALSLRDKNFEIKSIYDFSEQQAKISEAICMINNHNSNHNYRQENFDNILQDIMLDAGYEKPKDLLKAVCKKTFNQTLNQVFNEDERIVSLLNDIRKDKPYFLPNINPDDLEKVVCVKTKFNNPRIVHQQGAFLIFGIKDRKTEQPIVKSGWIVAGETASIRLIVDKEHKDFILNELKSFGISHQTLFPELDKQASHIVKRHKENQK